jgi:predicted phage terminase large subunit-like protein
LLGLQSGRCRRCVINMPPRSLKSTIVSVAWPAFLLGVNPATKILVTSCNEALAERFGLDTRRIMESDIYHRIFPGTRLTKRTNLMLETDRGGGRQATSIGGPTTGFGAKWIIIDDPHNALETHSPTAREAVKRYYAQALFSRLNNRPTAKMILVMQRLHEDDLTGHVLNQGGWPLVKLPAQGIEDTWVDIGPDKRRLFRAGELLLPTLLPAGELDDVVQQIGSAAYQAQYQQDPVPHGGNTIKREWLCYYDVEPSPDDSQVTLSVDTATKTDPINDRSAATVWRRKGAKHYLIYAWSDRVTFPDLKRKVLEFHQLFGVHNLLVEDQGTGTALIQEFANAGVPAIGRRSKDSKETRLSNVTTFFETQHVLFLRNAPWLVDVEGELLGFPHAKHDDLVDTISQYLAWVRERPLPPALVWDDGRDDVPTRDELAERILWMRRSGYS